MGRIVRSVSLDDETDKLAGEMGNFSKWVRIWIRQHHQMRLAQAIKSTTHNAPRRFYYADSTTLFTEVCWPFHKEGCCLLCWPDGPPNDGAYAEYTRSLKEGSGLDRPEGLGWHEAPHEVLNGDLKKGLSTETTKVKKSRFSRFLNWFSR